MRKIPVWSSQQLQKASLTQGYCVFVSTNLGVHSVRQNFFF